MTEQIVVKLNKKKFLPLLDLLIEKGRGISNSYSECVGKCVFFVYLFMTEKIPQLNNQTRIEHLIEKSSGSLESSLISFLSKYKSFLNSK